MKEAIQNRKAAAVGGILFLIFLVSSVLLWQQFQAEPDGTRAGVYQNGVLIKELSLDHPERFCVEDGENRNEIEVTEDGIRITNASCPDKICMHTVWTGRGSLPIVCLPNHLIITAVQSQDDEIDGITY